MNFFYNILDSILLEFADFSAFNFERPKVLWLLLLPVLFLLFEYFPARKTLQNNNNLRKFVDEHLIAHITKPFSSSKKLKRTLYFSSIFMLCILAIANPRWNYKLEEVFKPNVNIVLLLDVSKSMNADDVKPNRLERAKQEIEDIIKSVEGANIGLITFADSSNIIAPITDDKNALKYFLSAIDNDLFNERASRIDKGIESSLRMLKQYTEGDNFIIILSDGGFETHKKYESLISDVQNINIIGLGLGTNEGAPVPNKDGSFVKDENDKIVITKLDEVEFKKLVSTENYARASYLDDDTKKIAELIKTKIKNNSTSQKSDRVWNDRFYIPLILAMILFLFRFKRSSAFPVLLFMLVFTTSATAQDTKPEKHNSAFTWQNIKSELVKNLGKYFTNEDQRAEKDYKSGNYGVASEAFKSDFNKGLAEFKGGNLQQAANYFDNYIKNQNSEKLSDNSKADALYNLANTQMFMPDVEKAISTYEQVLQVNPNHLQAKKNIEIAKKILKEKKKQEEQQQNQQNKNNKNKDKNKSNKQDNNDNQNQNNSDNNSEKNNSQDNKNNDKNNNEQNQQKNENDKGDKKPNSEQNSDKQKQEDSKDGKNNGDNNQQSDTDKNKKPSDNMPQNGQENKNQNDSKATSQQRKTSLDTNAEEMMNRLKNDPSELLKRRFKMNKNQDNENTSGGDKPW